MSDATKLKALKPLPARAKEHIYVCGDACFIRSSQQGMWHKTDRCVAFVACPQCGAGVGELCFSKQILNGVRPPLTTPRSRQTHYTRRNLFSDSADGRYRNENVTQITIEDEQ